jgi:dTDP-4-amino-4,6-dideoxygalactose transaminase
MSYYDKNKKNRIEYQKKYYSTNINHIKLYQRLYYLEKRDEMKKKKKRNAKMFHCNKCNITIKMTSKKSHLKSKYHLDIPYILKGRPRGKSKYIREKVIKPDKNVETLIYSKGYLYGVRKVREEQKKI